MAGWSATRRLPGTRLPPPTFAPSTLPSPCSRKPAPRRPRPRAGGASGPSGFPGAGDSPDARASATLQRLRGPAAPAGFTRGGVVAVYAVVRLDSIGARLRARSDASRGPASRTCSGRSASSRGRRRADGDVARRRVARGLVRVEPRIGRRAALGLGLGVLPGRCADRPGPAAFHLPAALHRRADARADRLHRCAERQRRGLSALGYDAAARAVRQAVHVAEVTLRYLEAEAAGVAANPRFLAGAAEASRGDTMRSASRAPSAGPVRTRGPRARPPRPPPLRSTDPRAAGRRGIRPSATKIVTSHQKRTTGSPGCPG